MIEDKHFKETYMLFLNYQQSLHEKNQKKIRIGLKVNILLPLVFLIVSFITSGSKLVFLILWIVSLFGISFYLLYIEFTDFKLQQKMREFGLIDEDAAQEALIGSEVLEGMAELENIKDLEVFQDIKDLREGIREDISNIKEQNSKLFKPENSNENPSDITNFDMEADDPYDPERDLTNPNSLASIKMAYSMDEEKDIEALKAEYLNDRTKEEGGSIDEEHS